MSARMILTLTPNPSWKVHDFPLNSGDSWTTNTNIDYSGGFTYDAGSLGGSVFHHGAGRSLVDRASGAWAVHLDRLTGDALVVVRADQF